MYNQHLYYQFCAATKTRFRFSCQALRKSSFVLPLILNSKILDGATVHPPSSPTSARPRELEWGQKLSWTIFEKGAKEDWEDVGQERGNLG